MLMVASDRLSAFDVILGEPIPGKGRVLTQMALFWFAQPRPHRARTTSPATIRESVVAADEREQVRGRSMLVKRLQPLPIEAVVRGYLAGSGWKEYQAERRGLRRDAAAGPAQRLEAAGADLHAGDQGRRWATTTRTSTSSACADIVGAELAAQVRDIAIRLYARRPRSRSRKGIIIADTKFEFGLDRDGTLTLMDEVLTPDSSRFWPASSATPRARTRRASTSSSCATGSRRCASTASRGQEAAGAAAARRGRSPAHRARATDEVARHPDGLRRAGAARVASEQRHAELAPVAVDHRVARRGERLAGDLERALRRGGVGLRRRRPAWSSAAGSRRRSCAPARRSRPCRA